MREKMAAAFVCMLLSAAGAVAQQNGPSAAAPSTPGAAASPARDAEAAAAVEPESQPAKPAAKTGKRVQPGSQLDTVQTCRVHGQRTMEFIDQMTRSVQQARATNSPAQQRAALADMQAKLSQMKQHMAICMERLAQAH
jgi:hypothetical protein